MCTGNDNLYYMTFDRRQRLRVDLADWHGKTRFALYDRFRVLSLRGYYRLLLGKYSGNAGQYSHNTTTLPKPTIPVFFGEVVHVVAFGECKM